MSTEPSTAPSQPSESFVNPFTGQTHTFDHLTTQTGFFEDNYRGSDEGLNAEEDFLNGYLESKPVDREKLNRKMFRLRATFSIIFIFMLVMISLFCNDKLVVLRDD